jgi:hypothetical protein
VKRYATRIDDGTLHVESDDGWLEVGAMSDIYDLVGGQTYEIEYDDAQRLMAWVDAPDGTMTIDVREVIADMDYTADFVDRLGEASLEERTDDDYPERTARFAERMTAIWDAKGALEE